MKMACLCQLQSSKYGNKKRPMPFSFISELFNNVVGYMLYSFGDGYIDNHYVSFVKKIDGRACLLHKVEFIDTYTCCSYCTILLRLSNGWW